MPHRILLLATLAAAVIAIQTWTAPVPLTKPKEITNSIGMKLARIPPGKFMMGSPKSEQSAAMAEHKKRAGEASLRIRREFYLAEGPQHEVEITQPFWLGVHEVTQAQFKKVMGYNPSFFSHVGVKKEGAEYDNPPGEGKEKVPADTTTFPVENVSWEEAAEFCKNLTCLSEIEDTMPAF